MAYGSNNPGSDEDFFNDGPKTEPKDMQKDGDQEEGLLPKSLMAGKDFKPGDEIVLEVTYVGEKDFGVKYASEKGKDEGEHGDMPEKETADMGGGGGSEMESSMY